LPEQLKSGADGLGYLDLLGATGLATDEVKRLKQALGGVVFVTPTGEVWD